MLIIRITISAASTISWSSDNGRQPDNIQLCKNKNWYHISYYYYKHDRTEEKRNEIFIWAQSYYVFLVQNNLVLTHAPSFKHKMLFTINNVHLHKIQCYCNVNMLSFLFLFEEKFRHDWTNVRYVVDESVVYHFWNAGCWV